MPKLIVTDHFDFMYLRDALVVFEVSKISAQTAIEIIHEAIRHDQLAVEFHIARQEMCDLIREDTAFQLDLMPEPNKELGVSQEDTVIYVGEWHCPHHGRELACMYVDIKRGEREADDETEPRGDVVSSEVDFFDQHTEIPG